MDEVVFRAERHKLTTEHEAALDEGPLEPTMPANERPLHAGVADACEAKTDNEENAPHTPNETKMSDGHRERAWSEAKRLERWKTRTHNGWAFAPSLG